MAAKLHSALQSLGPVSFDEIPSSPTDLQTYVQDLLAKSRLIIESVPPPPAATATSEDWSPPPQAQATSASEIRSSSARPAPSPQSFEYDVLQKEWGKQVNKPNSSASKKEKAQNPLDIPVYKLGGKDGKGAWFARRSVHEGLGFGKWKRRMEAEFEETLRLRREKEDINGEATPGDGNIRGIGGEKRVERIDVLETETGVGDSATKSGGSGNRKLGKVEVYHLTAQFPGPTSPRDFVTLLITSDTALDWTGGTEGNVVEPTSTPRSYMVISKPCDHPDTQPREGFIRGQYESVEFIREVLVDRNKGKTHFTNKSEGDILLPLTQQEGEERVTERRRGKTVSNPQPSRYGESVIDERRSSNLQKDNQAIEDDDEADTNPVEWIMITRSDPGGTVPRWMVERGTPGSIVGDAVKFLDWACQGETQHDDGRGDILNTQGDGQVFERETDFTGPMAGQNLSEPLSDNKEVTREPPSEPISKDGTQKSPTNIEEDNSTQYNGLMSSVADMVSSYTPQAVRQYLPGQPSQLEESGSTPASTQSEPQIGDIDDRASVSSAGTFESAASYAYGPALRKRSSSKQRSSSNPARPASSLVALSQNRDDSSQSTTGHTSKVHIPYLTKPTATSQEREFAKLASRKQEAEAKLAAARSEYESFSTNPDTVQPDKDTQSQSPVQDLPENIRKDSSNKVEQRQQRKRAVTLNRNESKLISQINKLESQQVKLNNKIQAQHRKQTEREERAKGKQEIESLTREVERLRKEVTGLREERGSWIDLVGRLQRENTKLIAEAGGRAFASDRSSPAIVGSGSLGSG